MIADRVLFIADHCVTPHKRITNVAILCEEDKILAIGNASAFDPELDKVIYDLRGTYAVPGFIDTHIHGAGGYDSTTGFENKEDFSSMSNTLASHGVTSFTPTIISMPREKLFASINSLTGLLDKEYDGAKPVGIRLEGPFINKLKRGSQNEDFIRSIDLGEARELIEEGKGKIKIMTFAPELDNSIPLIELLLENDIIPSMGHTAATEGEALRAIDAGATHCTHLYNGMPPLHHRSIGIAGVALTDDRVSAEIILDGFHIHPRMVDIVCRIKPKNQIIGVSDAIQGAGLLDGKYHLGRTQVNVTNGRVTTEDGIIAGTTMTLESGWRHLMAYSRLNITDSAACLTINPANILKLKNKGELLPGRDADIIFLDSQTNETSLVIRNGKIIYINDKLNLESSEI